MKIYQKIKSMYQGLSNKVKTGIKVGVIVGAITASTVMGYRKGHGDGFQSAIDQAYVTPAQLEMDEQKIWETGIIAYPQLISLSSFSNLSVSSASASSMILMA